MYLHSAELNFVLIVYKTRGNQNLTKSQPRSNQEPTQIQSRANPDPIKSQPRSDQDPTQIQSRANPDPIKSQPRSDQEPTQIQPRSNPDPTKIQARAPKKSNKKKIKTKYRVLVDLFSAATLAFETIVIIQVSMLDQA
ncbi:hypothetical protein ACROYT_G000925 [Oculina patagonica]